MKPSNETVRRFLRWLWANLLTATGFLWWAKRQLRMSGAVIALTLHRVLVEDDFLKTNSLPGIVVRESTFRELVAHLADSYEPVSLSSASPGRASGRIRIVFTFDDGWVDNYKVAFPIARQHCVPVTIFICPGLMDQESPFWPERVVGLMKATRPSVTSMEIEAEIERLKFCTDEERAQQIERLLQEVRTRAIPIEASGVDSTFSWAAAGEMADAGIDFGSHTQTHQILTKILADRALREIRESKNGLESKFNKSCETFAYPNGTWSAETRCLLAEEGFSLAFTTERGAWTDSSDPLAIPRCNVAEDDLVGPKGRFSPLMFEYTVLWKAWRASKVKSNRTAQAAHDPAATAA